MARENLKQTPAELAVDYRWGVGTHRRNRVQIVRGVVEYNRDPDHRGRVMVRINEDGPEMHPLQKGCSLQCSLSLGWANPLFGQGSGSGFGAYTVPPVGARVFVMCEEGHPDQRLYFGGWVANSPEQRRYGVTESTITPPKKQSDFEPGFDDQGCVGGDNKYPPKPTQYQGHWMEEQGPERPLELAEMIDHTPDTQMFFKTLKGASMMVKERDEAEEMVITDRMGAELRFESNMEIQEDGVIRRNRVSSTQHEAMSLDNLAHFRHLVSLTSANRQGLEIASSTIDDDSVLLQTHPKKNSRGLSLGGGGG